MNLHAIELPQLRDECRVDGGSPRHRADAVTRRRRRWRAEGPKFDFHDRLQGALGKMSASNTDSAVFLTDSTTRSGEDHDARFEGGRETAKLQRELADLDIDVAYQWLRFFLEDDEELDAIGMSMKAPGRQRASQGAPRRRAAEARAGAQGLARPDRRGNQPVRRVSGSPSGEDPHRHAIIERVASMA